MTKLFKAGNEEQIIEDNLDRRGMETDKTIIAKNDDSSGRSVSVIIPMFASKNYKGTNCLMCHVVPEGTLLGTVRVDYSLLELDRVINKNLLHLSWINIAVMIIGLIMITWFIGHVALNPLVHIRNIMTDNSANQDLTQFIDIKQDDEVGQVASAFNHVMSHFSDSLSQVSQSVTQLHQSSSTISGSANGTANAADEQREETRSVSLALTQLEESADKVAVTATDVATTSSQADKEAKDGTTTTNKAIEGIYQLVNRIENASQVILSLDQHSEDVASVLDVIKGIAEQTNLLALNAAIEAARAGEQGRGFAVVADEVRTLATRSHESTQEIESIIEKLKDSAKQAVEVMGVAKLEAEKRKVEGEKADISLQHIAEKVSNINNMNENMNQTVKQQNKLFHQVQNNIQNIDSLSESTAENAQQTLQQSRDIVKLTDNLDGLLKQFKFNK